MVGALLTSWQLEDSPTPPSQQSYQELVCSYSWPCEQALAVMHCESRGDARAYAAGNYGLFQLNQVHRGRVGGNVDELYSPETNVRIAHQIWSEQGWRPWGCRFAAEAAAR